MILICRVYLELVIAKACEHGGMRGKCPRGGGYGVFEVYRSPGKGIEEWRGFSVVSIDGIPVISGVIRNYENNVGGIIFC